MAKRMNSRFAGKCATCGDRFPKGEKIMYDGKAHHIDCHGQDAMIQTINSAGRVSWGEQEDPEVALNRRENQQYEQGKADGREYQEDRKLLGQDMADQIQMEAEMFRYNNGLDDY